MADSLAAESQCQFTLTAGDGRILVQVGTQSHQYRISACFSQAFCDPTLEASDLTVVLHRKNRIDETESQPPWPVLAHPVISDAGGPVDRGTQYRIPIHLAYCPTNLPHHLGDLISSPFVPRIGCLVGIG